MGLMGNSGGSSEDQNANMNVDRKDFVPGLYWELN
jgi:hypothetical protein